MKKFLSFIFLLLITVTYASEGYRGPFLDLENHWSGSYANYCFEKGYIKGTGPATFLPDLSVTRAMLITALGRYADVDISSYKTSTFPDSNINTYYGPYIEWAKSHSIIKGYPDGTIKPNQTVSRAEMATIVSNFLEFSTHQEVNSSCENFSDDAKIPAWAKDCVYKVSSLGIITGFNNDHGLAGRFFDPSGQALRSYLVAIIYRMDTLLD